MIVQELAGHAEAIALWGLLATVVMATVLAGSQGLGLSRLSLPFLVGTFFTSDRGLAQLVGFIFYLLGGWAFAVVYAALFLSLGRAGWGLGALVGVVHALFLLVAVLPLLPFFHPRMASEYDGPSAHRRLEPPGFMGLNYGRRTPLSTVAGHAAYGALLGGCLPVA